MLLADEFHEPDNITMTTDEIQRAACEDDKYERWTTFFPSHLFREDGSEIRVTRMPLEKFSKNR